MSYEVENDKSALPESRFTIVENNLIRDGRLKRMSRLLMIEIMSHAESFVVTEASLVRAGREGRDAVRNALHELEQFGYLKRVPLREDGKFNGVRFVPIREPQPLPENPSTGSNHRRKTSAGKPVPENPTLKKTKEEHQEEVPVVAPLPPGDAVLFEAEKTDPPEAMIAKRAHDATKGALPYMGIRQIAKWAIHTRGTDPADVENAIAQLYRAGRAVTKTILGQTLDGYGTRPGGRRTSEQVVADTAAQVAKWEAIEAQQAQGQIGAGR